MVLSLDIGNTSIGAGGQVRKRRAVLGLDGLAFGGLEVVKSCGIGCKIFVLQTDETLTLERTWETENAPEGKLSKFN